MARYRILSIDGGGIRGIVPAIVLQRLSAVPSLRGWLDEADLLAGTSTGGLLALGIARPLEIDTIRSLYETEGERIFDDSWLDDVRDLGKITGAEYDIRELEKLLRSIFGETTLGELRGKVLVTAFDLDNDAKDPAERTWKPKIFHNLPGPDRDGDMLAYKVGLYTSAAPTYFPAVEGYIDGGVFASNPSMCALAQSQDTRVRGRPALEEVRLLSLGTGTSLTYIPGKSLDWGYAQWARPLVTLILDGVSGIADFQCEQILGRRYHRLAPTFPPGWSIPMDAVKKVPEMVAFAERLDLRRTIRWLEEHWMGEDGGAAGPPV